MEARISPGESASPVGFSGFSRKSEMRAGSSATVSMTPNWSASEMGWRMADTVNSAPDATCASTICAKSIRYTWSAPTVTTMSGRSSSMMFRHW